jgi:hypothetical protein
MSIDRIFLGFMLAVGVAVGAIVTLRPETRSFRVPPYFWVLMAMALFEAINFFRGRGAAGTMVSMEMRLLGFVLAIVLMVVIPILAAPLLPR